MSKVQDINKINVHVIPPLRPSYRYRRKPRKPSKLKIVKRGLITVTKEYCAESSIGGLKHLVHNDTPTLERILWVFILITGLTCSVLLVLTTFQKFYRAPLVTTKMPQGVSVSKIIFPAVGICTNNRISKRAVTRLAKELLYYDPNPNYLYLVMMLMPNRLKAERNKNYTEEAMLTLLFELGQLYELDPAQETMVIDKEKSTTLHYVLGEYNVNDVIKSLTPRCEDLLISCVWNNEYKHCLELFDFRLTVNGYCCTFNYLRPSDTSFQETDRSAAVNKDMYNYGNKSSFDYDQGLKVLLRLNETDDFFYSQPVQGAQLQFSDAYDFPDAPSGSFAMQMISPSVQMTVMVSASFTEASRDIQHVPIELRKCRFYDESTYLPFYTYSDCMLKCRMHFLLEHCNCTPFNMLKMENAKTCNMKDVPCLRKHYIQTITPRPDVNPVPPELELEGAPSNGGIYCPMCCPTCSKTAYSYDFYNVIIYPEFLNETPDDDRDKWLKGVNFTGASIVHVKYAREVADCYGQNVIMKWFDLISNIGSTCGFVTGFSFVSVLEFIYFYTVKLFREISSRRQKNITTESTVEAQFKTAESISRYRPIYWNELTMSTNYGHNFSETFQRRLRY